MRECCPTELSDGHSNTCDFLALPVILEISFPEKELYEAVQKYIQFKTCMAVLNKGYDPARAYLCRTSPQTSSTITFRVVELPDVNEVKH